MRGLLRSFVPAIVAGCMVSGVALASGGIFPIQIEGMSERDIEDEGLGSSARTTTGLPTVVVGHTVYLEAHGDSAITTSEWSLEQVPANSNLATGALGTTEEIEFVPDSVGSYQIGLVIDGGEKALLWITAAKFVGVGTIGGATPNTAAGQCGTCHSANTADWQTTGHSDAMVRKVDGLRSESCVSCHAAGWDDVYTTGGLDLASGWVWPIGGWTTANRDSIVTNHPNQAAYFNIQCENCHGPGSEHSAATDKNQMAASYNSDVCATCHDAGTHHIFSLQWQASAHGNYGDITGNGHASSSSCTRCHTAQGFVEETIDGGAAAAYDYPDPITCAACHDPHDGTSAHQLRRGSVADACDGCHTLRISSRGIHHSNQGNMIAGSDGAEAPGYYYPNSAHSDIEENCVACHMAGLPTKLDTLDDIAAVTVVGGHTFKIVGIDTISSATPDTIMNDTGCIECHGGSVSREFVEHSQKRIVALLDSVKSLLPQTTGAPAFSDTLYTEAQTRAAYNYHFVTNDGSYGVHNSRYAEALLRASISELTGGPTDVQAEAALPTRTALLGNMPNPFNPQTVIRYELHQAMNVSLTVYNPLGQRIRTLVSRTMGAGLHSVTWDGTDDRGMAVASGVYITRLATETDTQVRRMTLLR